MAYQKTVWVNGEVPLSEDNFNHMEEGISAAHNGLENVYRKNQVYAKAEADTKFAEKGSFAVVEFSLEMDRCQKSAVAVKDVSALISDIDDYVIIGVQQYNPKSGSSTSLADKWLSPFLIYNVDVDLHLTDATVFPRAHLYNDGASRKLSCLATNEFNGAATVKVKVTLFKYK